MPGNPLAARSTPLQPALVEEAIYRLAFLSLVCRAAAYGERQAAWLSGVLALLVHTYYHYSDEFLAQPLLAWDGRVMGLVWGCRSPCSLRRDLDAAVGFHWVQDAAAFSWACSARALPSTAHHTRRRRWAGSGTHQRLAALVGLGGSGCR